MHKFLRIFGPLAVIWVFILHFGDGTLLWPVLFTLYFVPVLVADVRDHHNKMAIAVLNVCLGWTLLGWVGALVWACTAVKSKAQAVC